MARLIQPQLNSDPALCCRLVLWRHRGQFKLTIVAKATLELYPDGPAQLRQPLSIVSEDACFGGSPIASDLVPLRPRCDVSFLVCAHGEKVRVAVLLGDETLLDKTLCVGEGRPSQRLRPPVKLDYGNACFDERTNPLGRRAPLVVDDHAAVRPGCFATIPKEWPEREQHAGATRPHWLPDGSLFVAPTTSFEYFQAAPPDQRVEYLSGNEQIVLDGLLAGVETLKCRLPDIRALAQVDPPAAGGGAELVPLVIDTLSISGLNRTCSVVWRGQLTLAEHAELEKWRVSTKLILGDSPVNSALRRKPGATVLLEELVREDDSASSQKATRKRPARSENGAGTAVFTEALPEVTVSFDATANLEQGPSKFAKTTVLDPKDNPLNQAATAGADQTAGANEAGGPKATGTVDLTDVAQQLQPALPFPTPTPAGSPPVRKPIAGAPWNGGASIQRAASVLKVMQTMEVPPLPAELALAYDENLTPAPPELLQPSNTPPLEPTPSPSPLFEPLPKEPERVASASDPATAEQTRNGRIRSSRTVESPKPAVGASTRQVREPSAKQAKSFPKGPERQPPRTPLGLGASEVLAGAMRRAGANEQDIAAVLGAVAPPPIPPKKRRRR